ncbi:MAG: IspD/TarI family cytidylyltransferase [Acidimicrobiia bacterium]
MSRSKDVWGILVAGGRGKRYGRPKHQVELGGRPMWEWGRDALLEAGAAGVVVVGPVPDGVPGGGRRRDSVRAGLEHVPESVSFVLVHDAARPLASAELARRVIDRLRVGDADGVVPALPVRDALKRVEGEWLTETLDRTAIMGVQTPQGFVAERLIEAHAVVQGDAPDDAALVEWAGGKVVAIAGETTNLKLTYPADLVAAEALLTFLREKWPAGGPKVTQEPGGEGGEGGPST